MADRELIRKTEPDNGIHLRKKPERGDQAKTKDESTGSHAGLMRDTRFLHSANPAQRAEMLCGLQRTHGNAYVQRLLIQAKLTVNPPDDKYEQEADQVAESVVNSTNVQRQEEEEEELMMKVQRQEEEEEEELIQPKSVNDHAPVVSDDLETRINAARGSGDALPDSIRTSFEPQLGHDFSDVRVHTGSKADSLSQQLQARAFTTGQDIFFRSGDYNPDSDEGKKLIGHEMTHVVQQGGAPVSRKPVEREEDTQSVAAREHAESELEKVNKEVVLRPISENVRSLLYWAMTCQEADARQTALTTLDETCRAAIWQLKASLPALQIEASTLRMANQLMEQLRKTVLPTDASQHDSEVRILEELSESAKAELHSSIKLLEQDPTYDSAQIVLEQAGLVNMLGGNPGLGIAALDRWANEMSEQEEELGPAKAYQPASPP